MDGQIDHSIAIHGSFSLNQNSFVRYMYMIGSFSHCSVKFSLVYYCDTTTLNTTFAHLQARAFFLKDNNNFNLQVCVPKWIRVDAHTSDASV